MSADLNFLRFRCDDLSSLLMKCFEISKELNTEGKGGSTNNDESVLLLIYLVNDLQIFLLDRPSYAGMLDS